MNEFHLALADVLSGWIEISSAQTDVLEAHYRLMLRWNAKLNLTRVTQVKEAARRHYGESLFLASLLPEGALRIIDVGSGAGFPGVPIATARPDCFVTLLESDQRKAVFLRESTRGWSNVEVRAERAERLESARWDYLVSRAVAWPELARLRIADRFAVLMSRFDGEQAGDIVALPWDRESVCALGTFHVKP